MRRRILIRRLTHRPGKSTDRRLGKDVPITLLKPLERNPLPSLRRRPRKRPAQVAGCDQMKEALNRKPSRRRRGFQVFQLPRRRNHRTLRIRPRLSRRIAIRGLSLLLRRSLLSRRRKVLREIPLRLTPKQTPNPQQSQRPQNQSQRDNPKHQREKPKGPAPPHPTTIPSSVVPAPPSVVPAKAGTTNLPSTSAATKPRRPLKSRASSTPDPSPQGDLRETSMLRHSRLCLESRSPSALPSTDEIPAFAGMTGFRQPAPTHPLD